MCIFISGQSDEFALGAIVTQRSRRIARITSEGVVDVADERALSTTGAGVARDTCLVVRSM